MAPGPASASAASLPTALISPVCMPYLFVPEVVVPAPRLPVVGATPGGRARGARAGAEVGARGIGAVIDVHVVVRAPVAVARHETRPVAAQVLVVVAPAVRQVEVEPRAVVEAEHVAVVTRLVDRRLLAVVAPAIREQALVGGAVALQVLVEPRGRVPVDHVRAA